MVAAAILCSGLEFAAERGTQVIPQSDRNRHQASQSRRSAFPNELQFPLSCVETGFRAGSTRSRGAFGRERRLTVGQETLLPTDDRRSRKLGPPFDGVEGHALDEHQISLARKTYPAGKECDWAIRLNFDC